MYSGEHNHHFLNLIKMEDAIGLFYPPRNVVFFNYETFCADNWLRGFSIDINMREI